MSKAGSLSYYENKHNTSFPNHKIKVTKIIGKYVYFDTKFGECKKPKTTFGRQSYDIRSALDKNLFTILKFKEIHKNNYIYDKVIVKTQIEKVIIICPIHGEFLQSPNKHLMGRGCEKCAREKTNKHQRENATGWSLNSWKNLAQKSKKFDSFKLYIIKCWSENEEFYKIGRTFKKLPHRFDSKKSLPYNYKIVHLVVDIAENIYNLETELKQINKCYKYTPIMHFNGVQECYSNFKFKN